LKVPAAVLNPTICYVYNYIVFGNRSDDEFIFGDLACNFGSQFLRTRKSPCLGTLGKQLHHLFKSLDRLVAWFVGTASHSDIIKRGINDTSGALLAGQQLLRDQWHDGQPLGL
tara:strand:+ start:422 stop:760 length:339 start_codon:yes stop_codon:yes gene_type:complete